MVDSTQFPYSAVGQVGGFFGSTPTTASGVLIAPDEVLTAAHVVWDGTLAANTLKFAPGLNLPAVAPPVYTVDRFHFISIAEPGGLINAAGSEQDFALLHLSTSVPGAGAMTLSPNFAGGTVQVAGYQAGANINVMASASFADAPNANNATLSPSPLAAGSSGGPIWTTGSNGAALEVGVVSSTGRDAALSTPIVSLINSWIDADHAAGTQPSGAIAVAPIDIHTKYFSTDNVTLSGGLGGDSIVGLGNGQYIVAGVGNETLYGAGVGDTLIGGTGTDFLVSTGKGHVVYLVAAAGGGFLYGLGGQIGEIGGAGADTFVVDAHAMDNLAALINFNPAGGDKLFVRQVPGSSINSGAALAAAQVTGGGNTLINLGSDAGVEKDLILVGVTHINASDVTFIA